MPNNHVRDQLAAYLDKEISPGPARARIESHVAECSVCREELALIQHGRLALGHLPVVEAPPELWVSIQSTADAEVLRRARGMRMVWRWSAAALLATAAAGVLLLWHGPRAAHWQVAAVEGSPVAGSRPLAGISSVATGQWVETDARSRARIQIGAIGSVGVEPNTAVRLVSADPKEHRLALAAGEIVASISAPPRLFFVDTAAGTAVDLGCEYRLRCDRAGTGLLQVTSGWVALEFQQRESLVPAGARCRLYAGRGPGTPWFDDATPEFIQALASVDSGDRAALATLLNQARARDTLTLWHLLSRAADESRGQVYDRMAELAPPPAGVTRERVLQLDAQTLKSWREELAWIW